jgi:hypothetical protein
MVGSQFSQPGPEVGRAGLKSTRGDRLGAPSTQNTPRWKIATPYKYIGCRYSSTTWTSHAPTTPEQGSTHPTDPLVPVPASPPPPSVPPVSLQCSTRYNRSCATWINYSDSSGTIFCALQPATVKLQIIKMTE